MSCHKGTRHLSVKLPAAFVGINFGKGVKAQIIDRSTQEPLSESEGQKLKTAINGAPCRELDRRGGRV